MRIPIVSFVELKAGRVAYRKYGSTGPNVVILPGLFGSGDNWHRIADALANAAQIWCLDLRNHGDSFHAATMSFSEMAQDVAEFCHKLDLTNIVLIGHSMGGKAAMAVALGNLGSIARLIIVDVAPKTYPKWHQKFLDMMLATSLSDFENRSALGSYFAEKSGDPITSQFLLKNVITEGGKMKWRIDIAAINTSYDLISSFPDYSTTSDCSATFVSGEKSEYLRPQDHAGIRRLFRNATFFQIANAGHWVQADQPVALTAVVKTCLAGL